MDIPRTVVTPALDQSNSLSRTNSRVTSGVNNAPMPTPGLGIGMASPGLPSSAITDSHGTTPLASVTEDQGSKEPTTARDYFTIKSTRKSVDAGDASAKTPASTALEEPVPPTPSATGLEPEKEEKAKRPGSLFGKKFQMSFPKKLGRTSSEVKPATEEKAAEPDKLSVKEKVYDENFSGVVQKIRDGYKTLLAANPLRALETAIIPCSADETPVLELPPNTSIIIQEDRPDSAVAADLYRGSIATVAEDADKLEKAAPAWLGDFVLRVCSPAFLLYTKC
jgi:WD repeat-containing protein 48